VVTHVKSTRNISSVTWVYSAVRACHKTMTSPWIVDKGDSLQIWMVGVNMLNKQSGTADKGWFSSLGVGKVANDSP